MEKVFLWFESFLSGVLPLTFLVVCGVLFTVKTRWWQFKNLFTALKFSLFLKRNNKGEISSFSAVCNSLAATVGTGNIAGVAAAISLGGAGSVFWMWVFALLSMVIKGAEITLAVATKEGENGGPLVYLKKVFKGKFSSVLTVFAFVGVAASFCVGNITQVNASVQSLTQNFYLKFVMGLVFCVVTAVVISGGAKKITSFTSAVLPFMAILYIVFCLGVIIKNYANLDAVFTQILKGAFSPKSATGGALGSVLNCVITGAKKGIFSNEAGIGTTGISHSWAVDANPKTQGLFGIFEVFVDTIVICTLTALTILSSGVIIDYSKVASSGLVVQSLATLYGKHSAAALCVMLCLFAISSIIGWAAYGIVFAKYLWGKKGAKIYVAAYPLFCVAGAVINVSMAFRLAEFFSGIMLCINLFAVLVLSNIVVKILKGEENEAKNRKNTKFFKTR
ncbi:MAG: sodium:alanine symporter family protein [Ruminococcaceae bacterium]|nr:sodium:alanine symporter family protein [Oscillospiraceae bacterium]